MNFTLILIDISAQVVCPLTTINVPTCTIPRHCYQPALNFFYKYIVYHLSTYEQDLRRHFPKIMMRSTFGSLFSFLASDLT